MTEEHPAACAECGSDLQPRDKFCPECGHKIPMVEVLSDDTEVIEKEEIPPPPQKRSRKPLLVGAMVWAWAGLFGLRRNRALLHTLRIKTELAVLITVVAVS